MKFFKKHIILTAFLIGLSFFIYWNFTKINSYERNINTKDKHFINELYRSDDRVYNNYLTDKQQKMYDYLIRLSKKYTPSDVMDIDEFGCSDYLECANTLIVATEALWVDHPELMNFATWTWQYSNNELKLRMIYAYPFPTNDIIGTLRIENIVSQIKEATKDMTDKEKIIYVYDWMGKHNYYDKMFMTDSKNQSIYNSFVKGNAVCAGFAKSSQIIFSQIGIESYIVSGTSTGPHMWNIVKYEDKYYFFDSTVAVSIDEGNENWHYKGLKQDYLKSFRMDYPTWYPTIEETNMFEIN